MVSKAEAVITINDVQYKQGELGEEAQTQLNNLRMTDLEIERLQNQLAIAKTARIVFGRALNKALPRVPATTLQ